MNNKIYFPKFGNFGQLTSYHKCNDKCYKEYHYFIEIEEDEAIEQDIDNYIESQVDERVFTGVK